MVKSFHISTEFTTTSEVIIMNDIELKQRVRATEKGLKRLDDRLNLVIQQDHEHLTRTTRLEDLLAEFILENKEGFAKLHRHVQRLTDSQEYWDRRMDEGMTELRRELAESQQRLTDSQEHWDRRMDEGMADLRRELAESQRRTDEQIAESQRRTDERIATGFAEFQKRQEAREARLDKKITDSRIEIGNLSHRLGTLVEDLVAPSLPDILKQLVKCPEEQDVLVNVRIRRRHPMQSGEMLEIDALADCGSYVLVNETKSQLTPEKVKGFLGKLTRIRDYFPEYQGHIVLGCMSSLFVESSLVEYASRQGLLVVATTAGLMTLQNPPGFIWRGF
jgi:hypothetical protein